MTDLGQFIGTLMASAAHARRVADEESLAIAEYYRDTQGLDGLSVPRMRMPEISLELPVLIEAVQSGEGERPAPELTVRNGVLAELQRVATEERINVPEAFKEAFDKDLQRRLSRPVVGGTIRGRRVGVRGAVASEVDDALKAQLRRREFARLFAADVARKLSAQLRRVASELAVEDHGKSPGIRTTVLTEGVKAGGDPGNVTRVRVVLKEEGLEWASYEGPDGGERGRLIPE